MKPCFMCFRKFLCGIYILQWILCIINASTPSSVAELTINVQNQVISSTSLFSKLEICNHDAIGKTSVFDLHSQFKSSKWKYLDSFVNRKWTGVLFCFCFCSSIIIFSSSQIVQRVLNSNYEFVTWIYHTVIANTCRVNLIGCHYAYEHIYVQGKADWNCTTAHSKFACEWKTYKYLNT